MLQLISDRIKPSENRNPILSRIGTLIGNIDATLSNNDSLVGIARHMLEYTNTLIDTLQHYSLDISYVDSQPALLKISRNLVSSHSQQHSQLELKCFLKILYNRCGTVDVSSQLTQTDIIRTLLKFHNKEQMVMDTQSNNNNEHDEKLDTLIDYLHLSLQNMLIFSNTKYPSIIGFNEYHWAKNRANKCLTFITQQQSENDNDTSIIATPHHRSENSHWIGDNVEHVSPQSPTHSGRTLSVTMTPSHKSTVYLTDNATLKTFESDNELVQKQPAGERLQNRSFIRTSHVSDDREIFRLASMFFPYFLIAVDCL